MSGSQHYYDDYWTRLQQGDGWAVPPALRETLDAVLRKDLHVLDAGCGDGRRYGRYVAERAGSYRGLEFSPAAVAKARELSLDARQQDLEQPFVMDAPADVALAIEVVEHLFNPEILLRSLHASLKPGGTLVATVPNIAYWRYRWWSLRGRFCPLGAPDTAWEAPWRDPHLRFFTTDILRRLLAVCGYESIRITGTGWSPRLAKAWPSWFARYLIATARKPV